MRLFVLALLALLWALPAVGQEGEPAAEGSAPAEAAESPAEGAPASEEPAAGGAPAADDAPPAEEAPAADDAPPAEEASAEEAPAEEAPAEAAPAAEGGEPPPAEAAPAAAAAPAGEPGAGTEVDVAQEDSESKATEGRDPQDDAYSLKIAELESRVNELKEKIFRSKTRLAILKETVLSSSIAGAEAKLLHRNEMGSSFRLEKVTYSLDGTPIFSRVDKDGDLDGQEEIPIYDGPMVPGNHTVSVVMVYRGNGYGIFSYLKGYVFRLRSSYTFRAEEGKRTIVKIVGYEKGGITTDLKERPYIRYDTELVDTERAPRTAAVSESDEE
jgi:uncharacterized small protein (DUF1192 family)